MISRREFLQAAAALAAGGLVDVRRVAAAQGVKQADLLAFEPLGQVTLLHLTDLHAQLLPIHFREPSVNIGVGEARGRAPHLTEAAFRAAFAIAAGSPEAYALTSEDFVALAREYGRMGGLDRIATLIAAIRAERGAERVLLLDGGDTWHGSWSALQTRGADMVACMGLLKPDAMVGHFEFTLGQERVQQLAGGLGFPFLAGNVTDEWKETVFPPTRMVERGGVRIGIVGQAFPFTPVANPRWMVPDWTFGIQEEMVRRHVADLRGAGAELVVLLSHNGYDVDRKMAGRVAGIDVILSGKTHVKASGTVLGGDAQHVERADQGAIPVEPRGQCRLEPGLAGALECGVQSHGIGRQTAHNLLHRPHRQTTPQPLKSPLHDMTLRHRAAHPFASASHLAQFRKPCKPTRRAEQPNQRGDGATGINGRNTTIFDSPHDPLLI